MDDIFIYISLVALLAVFGVLAFLLRKGSKRNEAEVVAPGPPAAAVQLRPPRRVGAVRRRERLQPANRPQNDSDSDASGEEAGADERFLPDGKIGAKKLRKLEEKAQRKAEREAEEAERKERKEREEKLERKRKKEDEQLAKQAALQAAEEQRLKEEKEKREYEEYLKMKEAFTVDDEGVDAEEEQDVQSLLQEFISFIEQTKVIMLEDLAARFKIKTQDAIDRVKTLQSEGRLSGVIDDRGKFICITAAEYESVARFIKQRGRVSITELADSMNRLIRLNADNVTLMDLNSSDISVSA